MEKQNGLRAFLILGDKCNLNCRYCGAQKLKFNSVGKDRRLTTYESLLKLFKNYTSTLIVFYGGEPLLYWDYFKEAVEYFSTSDISDKIKFTTMTNGSLLSADKVEFLNKHNIVVNLSHDGPTSKKFRGVDILEHPQPRENFLNLNQVWINSTYLGHCTLLELCEYYKPLLFEYLGRHGVFLNTRIGEVTPSKETLHLLDYDVAKISDEVENAILKGVNHQYSIVDAEFMLYRLLLNELILRLRLQDNKTRFAETIDIDLAGNLYLCSFKRFGAVGNIDRYDMYTNLLKAIKKLRYPRKFCMDCSLQDTCSAFCPYLDKTLAEKTCALRKAIFEPIAKHKKDMIESVQNPIYMIRYKETNGGDIP